MWMKRIGFGNTGTQSLICSHEKQKQTPKPENQIFQFIKLDLNWHETIYSLFLKKIQLLFLHNSKDIYTYLYILPQKY